MSRYQTLTVTTAVATLILIAIGAVVRTTESGLGCPDWPLCHGSLIPPAERTAIIEYTHRTVASIVGVLIVATAFLTLRRHRDDAAMRGLAAASLPLLALQAWLGKVTVERELPAEVVALHLATALILLSMLSLIAAFALQGPNRTRIETPERRSFAKVTLAAAAVTAGVVLIGSYVVGADAGAACTSWPGCAEAQVPFIDGGRLQNIHWLHRFTVVIGLLAIAAVAVRTYLMQEAGETLRAGVAALVGLYLLQILAGALNIWSEFAAAALVAHLAIGSAIWALLAVLTIAGRYRVGIEEPSSAAVSAHGGPAAEPGGAHA